MDEFDTSVPLYPSLASTEAKGIFQADVIIRGALVRGIQDLRRHPYLLDLVFQNLVDDDLTSGDYGAKSVARAKEWFLATEIPVVLDYQVASAPDANMLSIALVESSEAEVTLADLHFETDEPVAATWPALAGPFAVQNYDPVTGTVEIPTAAGDKVYVVPGMTLVDTNGGTHTVRETIDRYSFVIETNLNVDFGKALIKGASPRLVQGLESLEFKEVYRVGCHAHGKPEHLTWLHSITVWSLLQGKQRLLEARGFERSVISSAPFARDERFRVENMWTRFISLTGYVRQSWVKGLHEAVQSVEMEPLKIARQNNLSEDFVAPPDQEDPEWLAQEGVVLLGDD
jgi:hypothetical protein